MDKHKKSIIQHTNAIKKAHHRTRGTKQQMDEIFQTLKSMKSRLSGIRDANRNKNKDKLRALKSRFDAFLEDQKVQVFDSFSCYCIEVVCDSAGNLGFDRSGKSERR